MEIEINVEINKRRYVHFNREILNNPILFIEYEDKDDTKMFYQLKR